MEKQQVAETGKQMEELYIYVIVMGITNSEKQRQLGRAIFEITKTSQEDLCQFGKDKVRKVKRLEFNW